MKELPRNSEPTQSRFFRKPLLAFCPRVFLIWLVCVLMCAVPAAADQTGEQEDNPSPTDQGITADSPAPEPLLVYVPPTRGAPANRIGGGARGDEEEWAAMVLAPEDHAGRTISLSPILYWYQKPGNTGKVIFRLNDETAGSVLIRKEISREIIDSKTGGIQEIRTSDMGIRLKPENSYSWFITVMVDPADPSRDEVSGNYLKYTPPSSELAAKLKNYSDHNSAADKAALLASSGVWYDSLAVLMTDDPPDMKSARQLLGAVGIILPQ